MRILSSTDSRSERGFAMIAMLVIIFFVTIIGANLVAFMNSDITHAGIQGDVSRAFYVAEGGLKDALAGLAADQTYAGGTGTIVVQPGTGSFTTSVSAWGDPEARIFEIASTGQYGRYRRAIRALVQFGAAAPGLTSRNPLLFDGAGGAPARTYLAPYSRTGRGPDMGSFSTINFQDTGMRINALTGFPLTLQDGTYADYQLFGFASLPGFDPNSPTIPPALSGRFGNLMQFGYTAADFADLTVRRDPTNKCPDSIFNCSVSVLRGRVPDGGENMTDFFMDGIQKQVAPLATVDKAQLQTEARANTANGAINAALGLPNDSDYTQPEFECVLWYLARNPAAVLFGQVYVTGTVDIGARLPSSNRSCADSSVSPPRTPQPSDPPLRRLTISAVPSGPQAGNPALLAIDGGDLILRNNNTLQVGIAPTDARRQIAYGGVFTFISPTGQSGRIFFNQSSTFRGVGLAYTQNGIQLGPTSFFDLIGLSYNDGQPPPSCLNSPNCASFHSWSATAVIRFDPRASTRLSGGRAFLGVLAWWQVP